MDVVPRAFEMLEVAALDGPPGDPPRAIFAHQRLVVGKQWDGLGRAHVGEDEAAQVAARIGEMLDAVLEGEVRLGRLIEALAAHVV